MKLSELKIRDKFWLKRLIFFASCFFIFVIISFGNILFFNNSYMEEEREELNVLFKQIQWTIVPLLEKKDFEEIKKFSLDFKDYDHDFRIFDKNKKLISTSKPDKTGAMLNPHDKIFSEHRGMFKIYKNSLKDKKIGLLKEIKVLDDIYFIEITISEEDVLKTIIGAQYIMFSILGLFLIFTFWSVYYVLGNIRLPFNNLEDSVVKIANGNLDCKIDIQEHEILYELSVAIKKMTSQLKKQILMLKKLEKYKNDFIQNVSHEIKTPITAINMALELIEEKKDKQLNTQTLECLNIIKFQINYINTLVNDIFILAELEENQVKDEKDFRLFTINETVKNIADYKFYTAGNIKINVIEKETVNLLGDEDLIEKLISNILSNALKYSKTDKIDIIIDKNNENLILQIKDYGIGIPKEHHDKIFEKFYRVDKSGSRKKGGSGLGLAIVENIVKLHKGTITLKSTKNQGCNFIISIPSA